MNFNISHKRGHIFKRSIVAMFYCTVNNTSCEVPTVKKCLTEETTDVIVNADSMPTYLQKEYEGMVILFQWLV